MKLLIVWILNEMTGEIALDNLPNNCKGVVTLAIIQQNFACKHIPLSLV